jgi:7,8-dihydropterin-6-yl-methyl-4-(beta-D-ribofuranosyl)aminobenzene 5'-phosphate synthase
MKLQPVDQCDVTVLVDNVTDLRSSVPDNVTPHPQNLVKTGKVKELSGTCACCAHWGLSLIIRVKRGDTSHGLLFDSGPEGATVERNADRLGIDFSSLEEVMLSHGHWDHVGGMIHALKVIHEANGGKRVPVHVNEDMFVDRFQPQRKSDSSEADPTAGSCLTWLAGRKAERDEDYSGYCQPHPEPGSVVGGRQHPLG